MTRQNEANQIAYHRSTKDWTITIAGEIGSQGSFSEALKLKAEAEIERGGRN